MPLNGADLAGMVNLLNVLVFALNGAGDETIEKTAAGVENRWLALVAGAAAVEAATRKLTKLLL